MQSHAIAVSTGLRSRARAIWLGLGLAGAIGLSGGAIAETVEFSLDQGRVVARQALMSGNAQLARALAAGLLQADPNDPYALLIMTASETQLGRPAEGRKAGRAAWIAARGLPDGLRYDIARYTALAALQEAVFCRPNSGCAGRSTSHRLRRRARKR